MAENFLNLLSGPMVVAIDITNKCNFRCLHCYNNSGETEIRDLNDADLIGLFHQVVDIKPQSVCICGGEPLLRFNILTQMIKLLNTNGIRVGMVSNGYLFDENKALKFKEAGLDLLQISLDGFSNSSYQKLRLVPDGFTRAVNAIRLSKKHNFTTAVAICPTKFNFSEMDAIFRFCQHLGVDSVRCQPLMLVGRARDFLMEQKLSEEDYAIVIRKLRSYEKKFRTEWGDPLDHIIRNSRYSGFQSHFFIKANGDIALSGYLNIIIGNIKRHSIKEYWDSGYPDVWMMPEINDILKKVTSIDKMEFYNRSINIEYDLVEKKYQKFEVMEA